MSDRSMSLSHSKRIIKNKNANRTNHTDNKTNKRRNRKNKIIKNASLRITKYKLN